MAIPTIKQGISNIKQGFSNIGRFGGKVVKQMFKSPSGVQSFEFPLSIGGGLAKGAKAAGNVASKAGKGLINLFKRDTKTLTSVPSGGAGNVGKKILGGIAAGVGTGVAYEAAKNIVTGGKLDASKVLKSGVLGGAAGLSTSGMIAGTGVGIMDILTRKTGENAQSLLKDATNVWNQDKYFLDNKITELGNQLKNLPQQSSNIFNLTSPEAPSVYIESPQTPSMGGGGFNVNLPSGGFGENLPMMLLLLAGGIGAGGYLLGRRKRKKKKYKKRRRR